MQPGIYKDLSSEDYHGHKESYSRSALMTFDNCPRRYWAEYLNPNRPPKTVTDAMKFGSAYHTLILEPDTFFDRYAIKPEAVLLKDVGEPIYRDYKRQCEELEKTSKIILSAKDYYNLQEMKAVLMADEQCVALLKDAICEQSYFWIDEGSGLMLKSRPDAIHPNMILDLKTIDDAGSYNFQRSMMASGYHIQGAMVRDARRKLEERDVSAVINICQEKKYPYLPAIKIIEEAAIDAGEQKYKEIAQSLKHCIMTNEYRTYEPETVGLPRWAQN